MPSRAVSILASFSALFLACGGHLTAQDEAARSSRSSGLPLEPTQTFSFTVERGSWMSLDVSPDGRTIVFDLLGDVYTMPIEGGEATPFLTGLPFQGQPRYSPDGQRIAFISDASGGLNVWTVAVDGSDTTQVTSGKDDLYTSPEWTPDGQYLVVSKTFSPLGGAAKLWLYHVDGGSGTALIRQPDGEGPGPAAFRGLKTLGAAFGPDADKIWHARAQGDWQYNAMLPRYQVAVYDRETGESTTVTSRYGGGFRPAVSPDGRWLVYGSRHDTETGLRARDLATGEEHWVVYPIQRDDQESRATLDVLPGYAFTPDSREVVLAFDGRFWRAGVLPDAGDPVEIPFAANVSVAAGPRLDFDYPVDDSPTFLARQIEELAPSPDGRRVAFTALDRLYVAEHPGPGEASRPPQAVATSVPGGSFQPAWSPDGSALVFVSWDDRSGGHLWRLPAAGGAARRLTSQPAAWSQPAWSPDGQRIVAVRASVRSRQEGGMPDAELVWIPSGGGERTVIAPAQGRELPHFRTDQPGRIYLSRAGTLVSIAWDGTDQKEHLRVTAFSRAGGGEPGPADEVRAAPRGDLALARASDQLYVMPVPRVGGDTPTVSVRSPEGAIVPVRKLSELGAWWPEWGVDGRTVHWTLGSGHFVYDIDRAVAVEDSVAAAAAAEGGAGAAGERAAEEEEPEGEEADEPAYRPAEHRVEVTVTRDLPGGVAALVGGRVITMSGDEVIEDGVVVVRDNRIAAVGPRGQVTVPDGAEVIDVSGRTVMPGFVDTHAHLRPDRDIHTTQPWQYLANLAYGVTTTRDPQTGTTDVLTYADRVRSGDILGPRIYSTGPGVLGSYAGQEPIRNLDHARHLLRRHAEYFDTKTFKMYLTGNREQRQWLIQAARELELMPATEGGLDILLDLTHAIDGYPAIEHNLPVTDLQQDWVDLFARTKTTNTPTLLVTFGGPMGENYFFQQGTTHTDAKLSRWTPYDVLAGVTRRRDGGFFVDEEFIFDRLSAFHAAVVEAGGYAGVGSHGQLQGLGYHWELWMMQAGGLSNHDALKVATILGANGIGLEKELGSLEPGKLADIVVLDANPLDDIRNTNTVRHVMINGRLYDADDLSEVYPRQRTLDYRGFLEDPPRRTGS